jgi:hypothetical protein
MADIVRWIAGVSALLVVVNSAHAQSVSQDLIIRVYNSAGIPRDEVAAAERAADRIFRRAGLHPRWRECRTARGPSMAAGDPCTDVLQPRELVARFVGAAAADAADAAGAGDNAGADTMLGYALIDGDAQAGTMATVFVERVRAAAARLRVARATLLGRTVAHEIGHLLLGSNSHAVHGLMRAWWSDRTLRLDADREWRFSEGEARHMSMALAARARPEPRL